MEIAIIAGISAFIGALVLTPLIRFFAASAGIKDIPHPPQKNHPIATPLFGGGAIFFASIAALVLVGTLFGSRTMIPPVLGAGIVIGALFLIIGGFLDDRYHLSPGTQIIWPIVAVITVILSGLRQDNITNPLYYLGLSQDPLLHLKMASVTIAGFEIVFLSDLFTFVWLMALIYATKLLDGLNGLVSGMVVIGGVILFVTSMLLGQGGAAVLSFIIAGAFAGFLPYNMKGKIFLGEGGSTLAGFLLGVVALLGPAKITITLLVLGIPLLDVFVVIYERLFLFKKSPFQGDLRHIHFKLVGSGLSPRTAVIVLWLISFSFGVLGLVLQGYGKAVLLFGIVVCMIVLLRMSKRFLGRGKTETVMAQKQGEHEQDS